MMYFKRLVLKERFGREKRNVHPRHSSLKGNICTSKKAQQPIDGVKREIFSKSFKNSIFLLIHIGLTDEEIYV